MQAELRRTKIRHGNQCRRFLPRVFIGRRPQSKIGYPSGIQIYGQSYEHTVVARILIRNRVRDLDIHEIDPILKMEEHELLFLIHTGISLVQIRLDHAQKLSTWPELNAFTSLCLSQLAGDVVPVVPGCFFPDMESAEAIDLDRIALSKRLGHKADSCIDSFFSIGFWQSEFKFDFFDKIFSGHYDFLLSSVSVGRMPWFPMTIRLP